MRRKALRTRIFLVILTVVLLTAGVLAILHFIPQKPKGTLAEASVVRASLSSNLSSSGLVRKISVSTKLPLAALTVEDPESLSDVVANDYTVNLVTLLGEGSQGPVLYRVKWVNEELAAKTSTHSTSDTPEELIRLVPIYFDWDKAAEHYALEVSLGTTEAKNVREYVLSLLLREGISDADPAAFPDDFWREDTAAELSIGTETLAAMVLADLPHLEDVSYTVSGLVARVGEVLVLDSSLFTVGYSELFASFSLSEYDVAGIHKRLRAGERVYAAVGVNALSGRELIAEIVKIEGGSSSAGISYFTLLGRLVFPEITVGGDGTERGSYTYYDAFLDDATVTYLGVDLTDNLRPEEVLSNYSLTVTAQKAVVPNALVVPTKCIYYDDAKKPYVIVLDADKKEKRVYIKITLSTGTDAAVTAADGYTLNEGDVLRYTAEATLIGSLF
ncbi:MAG: hypothetical protein IJF73_01195 [Clostridia bacterium]|nr:hypothetical protein [Clostridia bacterium]